MNQLNLKVEKVEGGELLIRTGSALQLMPPNKIEIKGDIKSVSSFIKIREKSGSGLQYIDKSKAIISVNKAAMTIVLSLDPENHYGAVVTGKLEDSDELGLFHINKTKTFSKEELVKLIKFNRLFFANAQKHADMLLAFQKVNSTVNIKSTDGSDERGNKERSFVKDVQTNAPTEFILDIPIFKGFPASTFRVEVCLDVTEGSARFWFESTELHEMRQQKLEEIFSEELKCAEGFVIIND